VLFVISSFSKKIKNSKKILFNSQPEICVHMSAKLPSNISLQPLGSKFQKVRKVTLGEGEKYAVISEHLVPCSTRKPLGT
jgi:hypothetical protein